MLVAVQLLLVLKAVLMALMQVHFIGIQLAIINVHILHAVVSLQLAVLLTIMKLSAKELVVLGILGELVIVQVV
jgi:hypothetical protein